MKYDKMEKINIKDFGAAFRILYAGGIMFGVIGMTAKLDWVFILSVVLIYLGANFGWNSNIYIDNEKNQEKGGKNKMKHLYINPTKVGGILATFL